jgi:hypothetical protein
MAGGAYSPPATTGPSGKSILDSMSAHPSGDGAWGSAGLVLLLEAGESEKCWTENWMSQALALDDDALVIEHEVREMRGAVLGSRASSRCSGQCLGGLDLLLGLGDFAAASWYSDFIG